MLQAQGLSTREERTAQHWEAMFGFVLRDLSEFPNYKDTWRTSRGQIFIPGEEAKLA